MAKVAKTSKVKAAKRPVKRGKQVALSQSDSDPGKDAELLRGLTDPEIEREQSCRGWPLRAERQWVVKGKAGVNMSVKRKAGRG